MTTHELELDDTTYTGSFPYYHWLQLEPNTDDTHELTITSGIYYGHTDSGGPAEDPHVENILYLTTSQLALLRDWLTTYLDRATKPNA